MERKLEEILKCLDNFDSKELGLLTGLSGHILLHYEYSKIKKDNILAEKTNTLLNLLINSLIHNQFRLDFCSGLPGIGWMIDYLNKNNFISTEPNILFEEFDQTMGLGLNLYIKAQNYDYLHGINGYIPYYLNRSFNNIELKKNIDAILSLLTSALGHPRLFTVNPSGDDVVEFLLLTVHPKYFYLGKS